MKYVLETNASIGIIVEFLFTRYPRLYFVDQKNKLIKVGTEINQHRIIIFRCFIRKSCQNKQAS